jgi:hypothetical protein
MTTNVIDVRLSNPGDNVVVNNAIARPPPPGYYVIIGRGASAWYNHLTLLQTPWGSDRMSRNGAPLPVMHIGYEEPWGRRGHERMGQPPRMLDFFRGLGPGLGLPGGLNEGDWLPASEFAATIRAAENEVCGFYRLVERPDGSYLFTRNSLRNTHLVIKDGFVGIIEMAHDFAGHPGYLPAPEQARAAAATATIGDPTVWLKPTCPYRISVYHNRVRSFVYAHKIDICTGPGQARLFPDTLFATPELYQEHIPQRGVAPEIRPADQGFPRILDGNEYIGSPNDPDKSVLVFKGNPVGAQSAQSALDMPLVREGRRARRVWWVISEDIRARNAADVPGRRNLLEIVGNSQLQGGEAAAITTNHPLGALWALQATRDTMLSNRLHRVGWHEIARISEGTPGEEHGTRDPAVPGIKCTFSFHPYGDPQQAFRPAAPAGASASVRTMMREAAPAVPGLAEGLDLATQPAPYNPTLLDAPSIVLREAIADVCGVTPAGLHTLVDQATDEERESLITLAGNRMAERSEALIRYVRDLKVRIDAPSTLERSRALGSSILVERPTDISGPRERISIDSQNLRKLVDDLNALAPNPQPFFAYVQVAQRGRIDGLVEAIGRASEQGLLEIIQQDATALRAEVRRVLEAIAAIEAAKMVRSITTDLLVYSLGQERGVQFEGTVSYMTQRVGALTAQNHAGSGFPMALIDTQVDPVVGGGCLRVLGAAILTGPTNRGQATACSLAHVRHGSTLPQEAPAGGPPVGGGGYGLAMTNIRRANHFVPEPARLNTFSADELQAAGLSEHAATAIVAARSITDRGLTPAEYEQRLGEVGVEFDTDFALDIELIRSPALFRY